MIIPENREKVKKKAQRLISKLSPKITKPEFKFILEMVLGQVTTGSSNLSEIARVLGEKTAVRHTLKRLRRMLQHCHILEYCNELCLKEMSSKVTSETILALDGGDITHQYGEKFELQSYVHDGSKGKKKIAPGYWLNQVSGFNPSKAETFPVQLDVYSALEKDFKSANSESLKLVKKIVDQVGDEGLWVMDRGYDSGIILKYFFSRGLNFVTRMKSNRNLVVNGKSINIKVAAGMVNRRIKYNNNCRFGSLKAFININKQHYEVTLVCFKDKRNKEPMLLLCNGWIKSGKELKRRIRGYFHRWGVEESYRFEKQGFGIERCTLRKFSRIRTMIGISVLSWLLLIKINQAPKLREVVLKKARMEKDKTKNQPKFIYYRLIKGVQHLFAGVKELFRFRWKREKKLKYIKEISAQPLLFNEKIVEMEWLEVVA